MKPNLKLTSLFYPPETACPVAARSDSLALVGFPPVAQRASLSFHHALSLPPLLSLPPASVFPQSCEISNITTKCKYYFIMQRTNTSPCLGCTAQNCGAVIQLINKLLLLEKQNISVLLLWFLPSLLWPFTLCMFLVFAMFGLFIIVTVRFHRWGELRWRILGVEGWVGRMRSSFPLAFKH